MYREGFGHRYYLLVLQVRAALGVWGFVKKLKSHPLFFTFQNSPLQLLEQLIHLLFPPKKRTDKYE